MKKLRIFLVEDSELVSENLKEMIHELGNAEVIGVARSETEALSWCAENKADMYIVDIMLRDGNGLNVLKLAETSEGAWIVFSNHSRRDVEAMAQSYGAICALDKSNQIDTLLLTVQQFARKQETAFSRMCQA